MTTATSNTSGPNRKLCISPAPAINLLTDQLSVLQTHTCITPLVEKSNNFI